MVCALILVLWCSSDVLSKHTHTSDVFTAVYVVLSVVYHSCIDQICDVKGVVVA